MSETVYGDLLFLINFSMDFLCFYITAFLLHTRLSLSRGVISSCIGGVYAVAVLFIDTGQIVSFVFDVLCCALMCVVVFYKKHFSLWGYIKSVGVYFFVSMLLGGIMTGLFSLFNRIKILSEPFDAGEGISVWIFALLASVSAVCTLFGGRLFRSSTKEKTAELSFCIKEKSATVTALVDSGNLVSDPVSGKAVAVVALPAVRDIVPSEMLPVFENLSALEETDTRIAEKLRVIPASTVFGGGVMLALKPERVSIGIKGKRIEKDILIALVNRESFGTYSAILPEEIFT